MEGAGTYSNIDTVVDINLAIKVKVHTDPRFETRSSLANSGNHKAQDWQGE